MVIRSTAPDPSTDALYSAWIQDAMASVGGQYLGEDAHGMYVRIESPDRQETFIDLMESTDRATPGAAVRFRDICETAEVMVSGQVLAASSSDPLFSIQACYFDLQRIDNSWNHLPPNLTPVIVAVLDTGISANHQDLVGRIVPGGKNFLVSPPNSNLIDVGDHGTRVAGIIAANSDNGVGMAGCAPFVPGTPLIRVLPLKVLEGLINPFDPTLKATNVAAAIHYAVDQGAHVINMSFDFAKSQVAVSNAIDFAVDSGLTLVAGAGNDDDDDAAIWSNNDMNARFPASDPEVIAVGSVNCQNTKANHSNWGPQVDVTAGGFKILGTTASGNYDDNNPKATGSSYSAAFVSGLAALVKSILPLAEADDVKELITENAGEIATEGNKKASAHGTVNFKNTVIAAANLQFGPPCAGLPALAPVKVKASKKFAEALCRADFSVGLDGTPVDIKSKQGQCDALTALAFADGWHLQAKSVVDSKKEQTQFELKFVAPAFPTQNLKLHLEGLLLSTDGLNREIQVRFYDYSEKKWGMAINKPVSAGAFSKNFPITDDLFDHIKSPKGIVRCKVRVRHLTGSSKLDHFDFYVTRADLVVN